MPKRGIASRGEAINHFNGVRLRVIGAGDLQVTAWSLQEESSEVLLPYTMQAATRIQPTLLMNTKEHRVSLEIKITEINEWFIIGRLIIFSKPLFTSVVGRG